MESRLIEVMNMKMFSIQFVSIVNLIQIQLMKVSHNMKNIPIREFQHSLESKLIEGITMKMLPIQFVSNVNLIQIKWIEVANGLSIELGIHLPSEHSSRFDKVCAIFTYRSLTYNGRILNSSLKWLSSLEHSAESFSENQFWSLTESTTLLNVEHFSGRCVWSPQNI
jgi:hypothetical protein